MLGALNFLELGIDYFTHVLQFFFALPKGDKGSSARLKADAGDPGEGVGGGYLPL